MNCKDCLHYEACKGTYYEIHEFGNFDEEGYASSKCDHFKDKTKFIELPCIAMVEQFIKDGKFDKKHTAHNGKIAVVYIDKSKWNSPLIDITEKYYNTDKAYERMQVLKEREEKYDCNT